ncbi:unnamed protein product [Ectocarpus sp. 4 AP-2014]
MATVSQTKSPLVLDLLTRKIARLSDGIAVMHSGLAADASRILTKKAEACCLGYKGKFGEQAIIPVGNLVAEVASILQEYTQMGGVRPFGAAFLVAGIGDDGHGLLYRLDPSGSVTSWKAAAIGKGSAEAEVILHEEFEDLVDRDHALELALSIALRCSSGTTEEDVETAYIERGHRFDGG